MGNESAANACRVGAILGVVEQDPLLSDGAEVVAERRRGDQHDIPHAQVAGEKADVADQVATVERMPNKTIEAAGATAQSHSERLWAVLPRRVITSPTISSS